jgi:ectoine hydroxylase-related dioxygenase (phytanoyl-CoA dioxygenase family)
MISAPIQQLNAILQNNQHISETLDHQVLNFLGVFIVKNAFKPATIDSYASTYFKELNGPELERNSMHLTEVKIHAQNRLNDIVLEPEFQNIAATFFQGNVGTDFIRVVKKDRTNVQPVFLHQDTCYQVGGFDRYSLFIPLTPCNFDNGGLVLYLGTHHFGYLGDAGEISDVLPSGYPKICPNLIPGDALIMHSATWHESPENKTLSDRVYLEAHIQDSNDPTTKIEICGQRNSEWVMHLTQDQLFHSSRAQRIKRLQQEIENLKAVPA